jgi:hypothetical protein
MCALTLYPRGDPSDKVSFRSISACYSCAGSNRLPQSYMVLRSLYGLRPMIRFQTLRVWVGRTSTRLDFKVFQNINLLKSINYILQLTHNEVDGGSSHPRCFFVLFVRCGGGSIVYRLSCMYYSIVSTKKSAKLKESPPQRMK